MLHHGRAFCTGPINLRVELQGSTIYYVGQTFVFGSLGTALLESMIYFKLTCEHVNDGARLFQAKR